MAHLHRQHQHVSYIPSLLPSVYGSVITCTGETPLYVKAGQMAFPVCLEIATSCYHMESRPECLFPSACSKIRHNRLWGRLYKVLGLSSRGCVYRQTAGCATVSYCICQAALPPHAPPRLQGRLDWLLISGHSYMVAQTDRGHEPHPHYTLSTHSHLHMCVNRLRVCVMIVDINKEYCVALDFDMT